LTIMHQAPQPMLSSVPGQSAMCMKAAASSKNTPFRPIAEAVGMCNILSQGIVLVLIADITSMPACASEWHTHTPFELGGSPCT